MFALISLNFATKLHLPWANWADLCRSLAVFISSPKNLIQSIKRTCCAGGGENHALGYRNGKIICLDPLQHSIKNLGRENDRIRQQKKKLFCFTTTTTGKDGQINRRINKAVFSVPIKTFVSFPSIPALSCCPTKDVSPQSEPAPPLLQALFGGFSHTETKNRKVFIHLVAHRELQ